MSTKYIKRVFLQYIEKIYCIVENVWYVIENVVRIVQNAFLEKDRPLYFPIVLLKKGLYKRIGPYISI